MRGRQGTSRHTSTNNDGNANDSESESDIEEVEIVVKALHAKCSHSPYPKKKRRGETNKAKAEPSKNLRRYGILLLAIPLFFVSHYTNVSIADQLAMQRSSSEFVDTSLHNPTIDELLPDWRVVTDCSTYNTDCAAQIQGNFQDYPFKVKLSEDVVGEDGQYDFDKINTDNFPKEWSLALEKFAPSVVKDPAKLELDGKRRSALVFPPKVDPPLSNRCYDRALSTPFNEQLDNVLSQLNPVSTIDTIAWTMSDRNYSEDMLVDAWQMNNEIVGFQDAFFFLALDKFTLRLACEYGYPVVAAPALTAEDGDTSDLKHLVQSTKFIVSKAIVERQQNFFFYEMDCWFLKSPINILRQQTSDYLVSSHQWNPSGGNIGIFSVKANQSTREFFDYLLHYSEMSPETHDQVIMNDLATFAMKLRSGMSVEQSTAKHLGRWQDPVPLEMPEFKNPMSRSFFDPHVIVASPYPILAETTVAIHTLDQAPLQPPHGKKMVAKELGVYTGFSGTTAGYYKRSKDHRRYLLLDGKVLGGLSFVQKNVYHNFLQLQWHVAIMVALARRTDRILILPRLAADFHVSFLWANLDMQSLEGLVDVRETNFPSNKKAWFSPTQPFESVARVGLFPGSQDTSAGRLFAQTHESNDIFAWEIEGDGLKVDALFGLVSSSRKLHEVEALFFNPSFTHDSWDMRLATREEKGQLGQAEIELLYAFDELRWCSSKINNNLPSIRFDSSKDCYGKGLSVSRYGKTKTKAKRVVK